MTRVARVDEDTNSPAPCRHVEISTDKLASYGKCHTAVMPTSLHNGPPPKLACSDTDANCCNRSGCEQRMRNVASRLDQVTYVLHAGAVH